MTRGPADELFADGPARDERMVVVDHWRDCANYPEGDPQREVEFVHRQMNEEVNGLECSARALTDFPDADWDLRLWLARQCWDEARHCRLFRRVLEGMGGNVGDHPVLNFQYRIITKADTLIGRLTIQNRSFEAGGLDAISSAEQASIEKGNATLADLFDGQLADEIVHVRFANEWIARKIEEEPRSVLDMGRALAAAARGFAEVMGTEGVEQHPYQADRAARIEAGFREDEVDVAERLASAPSTP